MRAWGYFELDWYFETKADMDLKLGFYDPIYETDSTSEQIDSTVETAIMFLERLNVRWADDRTHAAGSDVTAADFSLLAFYTSIVMNPKLNEPQIGERLQSKLDQDLPNTKRVIKNISKHLTSTIEQQIAQGTSF